jgi:anti-anti-sigma regulatory factor
MGGSRTIRLAFNLEKGMTTINHPPTPHQNANGAPDSEMRVPLRRVKALYRINEMLAEARIDAAAFDLAAKGLVAEAGYVNVWIATVDRTANMLQGRAGAGAGSNPQTSALALPLDAPAEVMQAVHSGQAGISEEAVANADRDGWGDLARESGLHSVGFVPLVHGDTVIGVVAVGFLEQMHAEEEITLLKLFASQLTAALERIRLDRERAAQIAAMEAAAEQQARLLQTVRDLSTPAMPVYDGVLVMPLVGHVDSLRAGQIMETVLTGISREHASVVIIDVTGVPVIDTGVANYLVQVTQAAQLLGARALLVGITPEVAQTLVQLGVDLSGIATRANLQMGVAYALQQRGLRVVEAAT